MDQIQSEDTPLQSSPVEVESGSKYRANQAYQAIGRKYFPVLSCLEDVSAYRIAKSEILSSAQLLVLKYALSPEKLQKATFLQLCQGFEILNKSERLDQKLSTENVTVLGRLEIVQAPLSS